MPAPGPYFPADALVFLRALKRHNDRDWFRERKARYEASLRGPMIEVIEQLGRDFRTLAPEIVATPKASLYRIYRDTRFSADKTPLKTHVAAHFPHHAFTRNEGAGLYLHVAPDEVLVAGGIYAPQPAELHRLREHIARHHRQLQSIVTSPRFRREVGALAGETLTRVPRGFAADHPAAELLKRKQFIGWREFPAVLATSATFYRTVLACFTATLPLVRFINDALLTRSDD
ncbi:MAG: DUF2461 domain-containing protein [Vicinamibacterales bacterium]